MKGGGWGVKVMEVNAVEVNAVQLQTIVTCLYGATPLSYPPAAGLM